MSTERAPRQFVPMSEANTDRIRTSVSLPFKLEEKIGLNVGRIETLLQLGGFADLKISQEEDKETSSVVPMVVGINNKGEAVAGKAKVKVIPISQESVHLGKDLFRDSRWSNLDITLNIEELQQRLLESGNNIQKTISWVRDINQTLTRGIIRAGLRNLLSIKDRTKEDWLAPLIYYGAWHANTLVGKTFYGAEASTSWAIIANSVAAAAVYHFLSAIVPPGPERKGSGTRFSVFIDFELDRAIGLFALGNLSTLAKPIDQKVE